MRTLCIGMMVCDIPLATVPYNILKLDSWSISSPIPATGGDALSVSIGLAKLGIQVSLVGRIGPDLNGSFIKECARSAGVDISAVMTDFESSTATSYVLIDTRGERHFLTNNQIFTRQEAADVPAEKLAEADIVYFGSAMSFKSSEIEKIFKEACAQKKRTILDTAMCNKENVRWMEDLKGTFKYTHDFLPSFDEAKLLTGKTDPSEMALCFKESGMENMIIKLGSEGCYVTDFAREKYIKAIVPEKVVDTTGAGDSFVAGYICGLSKGWDVFKSAAFANSVASHSVTVIGATAGIHDFESAFSFFEANCREN